MRSRFKLKPHDIHRPVNKANEGNEGKATMVGVSCDMYSAPFQHLSLRHLEDPFLQTGFELFSANFAALEMRRKLIPGNRCRDTEALRTELRGTTDIRLPTFGGTQSCQIDDGVHGDPRSTLTMRRVQSKVSKADFE